MFSELDERTKICEAKSNVSLKVDKMGITSVVLADKLLSNDWLVAPRQVPGIR
jgi:hypothetical protein